jgi:hypothetical protein
MKVRLLFRDKDVDWSAPSPWNDKDLRQDLAVDVVLDAMAAGDPQILKSADQILLAGVDGDISTIRYRQSVLQDCLSNPAATRELFALATEAADKGKRHYLGSLSRYPHWALSDATEQMETFVGLMRRLRSVVERNRAAFAADAWRRLFAMLESELDDAYLAAVRDTLDRLRFRGQSVFSAQLGPGNKPDRFVLHEPERRRLTYWMALWRSIFPRKPPPNSFSIHPRDEAGHRALERLRDQGIASTANALSAAKDHVRHFFATLRAELAFYIGCLNLHERLAGKGEPICMPSPHSPNEPYLVAYGLYDVGLTLSMDGQVVGNDVDVVGKALIIVTGANQGGKSTFLRSLGLAQLMMQAGMFVAADGFSASTCQGLFTHYKREEDIEMKSGKFDEELSRMSQIVDRIAPRSLILFNESFAATNEREGSEIARQIITALLEKSVRVACVTHLFDLAHGLYASHRNDGLFLRAPRMGDRTRSFRLTVGEPLPTSFGEDLYDKVFSAEHSGNPMATRR